MYIYMYIYIYIYIYIYTYIYTYVYICKIQDEYEVPTANIWCTSLRYHLNAACHSGCI